MLGLSVIKLLPLLFSVLALGSLIFGMMRFLKNAGKDEALAEVAKERIERQGKRDTAAGKVAIKRTEKLKKVQGPCQADPLSDACIKAGMDATDMTK